MPTGGRPKLQVLPTEPWMDNPKRGCKNQPQELFFPQDGHFLTGRSAIEICNTCPVQIQCLDYALRHRIDDGIWGGTGRNERRRILRARRRVRLAVAPSRPSDSPHG